MCLCANSQSASLEFHQRSAQSGSVRPPQVPVVRKRKVKAHRASTDSQVKANGLRSVQAKGKDNISRVPEAHHKDSVRQQALRAPEVHLVPADLPPDSRSAQVAGRVDQGRRQ